VGWGALDGDPGTLNGFFFKPLQVKEIVRFPDRPAIRHNLKMPPIIDARFRLE
jgi:hypothetical protein